MMLRRMLLKRVWYIYIIAKISRMLDTEKLEIVSLLNGNHNNVDMSLLLDVTRSLTIEKWQLKETTYN